MTRIGRVKGSPVPVMVTPFGGGEDSDAVTPSPGDTWIWDGTAWVPGPAGGGTPATTVTDETTWGITPAVGTDTEYARQDHTHGSPPEPSGSGVGEILISDTPSTPLIFGDLIQNEAQDDLVYAG